MKQITAQVRAGAFYPFSREDLEAAREYRENQLVMIKVSGTRKARSLRQLRAYWAACQTVADNSQDIRFSTKEKVDFCCRVDAHFVEPDLVVVKPDGSVIFSYRSISFENLKHIEACNYFDRAFEFMSKILGCKKEDLTNADFNRSKHL